MFLPVSLANFIFVFLYQNAPTLPSLLVLLEDQPDLTFAGAAAVAGVARFCMYSSRQVALESTLKGDKPLG